MASLDEIRIQLTNNQRAVVNAIWEHHLEQTGRWDWIPPNALFRKFANPSSRRAGMDFVFSTLSSLSGSVVYEHQDHYYALTFLGVLLTDQGRDGIDILARCFELFQKKHDEGLDIKEIKFDSEEIKTALSLSEGQLRLLYELIDMGPLGNAGGDKRTGWNLTVTPWRGEFLTEDNLRSYFENEAINDYDPFLPVGNRDRSQYLYENQNKALPGEFSFIRNDELRELLEVDWKEAQTVHAAKAWKSCVILCGSILEGMLFDIIGRDEPKALAAYATIRSRDPRIGKAVTSVRDLTLNSMVEVANELKMLPPGPFHLSHALRHSRNLVHPEKQLREKVEDIENEANIALSSMKVFLRIASTI